MTDNPSNTGLIKELCIKTANNPCIRFCIGACHFGTLVRECIFSCPVVLLIVFLFLNFSGFSQSEKSDIRDFLSGPYYDNSGKEITMITVPGKPPVGYRAPESVRTPDAVIINSVPAFDWSFGCAPTAAAMAAGYYDNTGYPDMYTGPVNNGLMPMDNTIWGTVVINNQTNSQCPLSATRQGLDGRITRGHVDDFWNYYENGDPDPYIVNNWTRHSLDSCTGDFMGSNQSAYNNPDGASTFFLYSDGTPLYDFTELEPQHRDACHGLRLFYESHGYEIVENFSQMIAGYNGNSTGFTFNQYTEEIDNGRPVLIHIAGHTMIGYGYDETTQLVYLHDTWDHAMHSMTWAGNYAGRQHFGITVIRLQSDAPPPVASFIADPRTVDPGQSVDFSDTSSGSPISWQWTFEGGNPATSIEQNPVITYNVPGVYTVTLVATNSIGYDTEIKSGYISVNPCFASGDCHDYISGIELLEVNNLNNECGNNGYSDYTAISASVVPGKITSINILKDSIITINEKCGLWFDWNRDNDFTDAGEFTEISSTSGTNIFQGSFIAPLNALADSIYRMRIRVINSGELNPCGYSGYGETEDYSIHLLKPEIVISPDSLDFGGIVRFHCSESQPYTVSAYNVSSPLLISASPDMSISFDSDSGFTTALSIQPVNDSIPETNIYVKYCVFWTTGEYEFIYNSCPGADTKIITLHGYEVIPPPGNAPKTYIGAITSMPDTIIRIPVTTSGFSDVQFGNLNLNYNPDVLVFQGIENIHPELNWWLIDAYENTGNEEISYLNLNLAGADNPRSIPDNEKIFDLVFSYTHSPDTMRFDTTQCNWEDTWYHTMNDIPSADYYFNGSVSPEARLVELKIFLECIIADDHISMRKAQGESGNQFPGIIADNVFINLARSTPPYNIIESIGLKPLLQDGTCKFTMPLSFNEDCYIVISHRNSIETWSANPVNFSGDYLTYNFTNDASKAYGNNLKLIGEKYCIFCGDVNLDGTIDSADMTLIDNDANNFVTGYIPADLSGDGIIDIGDMTILDNNANNFVNIKMP